MSEMSTFLQTLTAVECADCHMVFGVTEAFQQARRQCHDTFYCPSGHANVYLAKTKEEKLRDQVEWWQVRSRAIDDQRAAAERSAAAYKGQATKVRNRVARGVCPCCTRSFSNLRDHMASQHPAYVAGGSA